MDKNIFKSFGDLVYAESGITLGEGKESLVAARVRKRMRTLAIKEYSDYLRHVQGDQGGTEIVHLLDAISTNVTSFYREPAHFEVLSQKLKEWRAAGQRDFTIWCAAASTGEEPVTLAMTLQEALGQDVAGSRILATDISTEVLQCCKAGQFKEKSLESVPREYVKKYFTAQTSGQGQVYSVNPSLTKLLTFARLNLSTPPFVMKGPFDVVFCRNVMIYFDNKVRIKLLDEISRLLKDGGLLMVGSSESLAGIMGTFKNVQPSVYEKS